MYDVLAADCVLKLVDAALCTVQMSPNTVNTADTGATPDTLAAMPLISIIAPVFVTAIDTEASAPRINFIAPVEVNAVDAFALAERINLIALVVVSDDDTLAAAEYVTDIFADDARDVLRFPAAPFINVAVALATVVVGLLAAPSLIKTNDDDTLKAEDTLAARSLVSWPADAIACADMG